MHVRVRLRLAVSTRINPDIILGDSVLSQPRRRNHERTALNCTPCFCPTFSWCSATSFAEKSSGTYGSISSAQFLISVHVAAAIRRKFYNPAPARPFSLLFTLVDSIARP